jgi:hypothetical protein
VAEYYGGTGSQQGPRKLPAGSKNAGATTENSGVGLYIPAAETLVLAGDIFLLDTYRPGYYLVYYFHRFN